MGYFRPLSALHERRIVDPNGVHVGHIRDVLIDLREGRIEYVCIAIADAAGDFESEAIVPWSALRSRDDGMPHWEIAAGKDLLHDIAEPVSQHSRRSRQEEPSSDR